MPFQLTIVTPSGEAYCGPVDSVLLPGSEGDFGVLPEHERFLTPLRVGEVKIETGSETLYAAIADGFADVSGDQVAVLVESCDLAHEIDVAKAEHDLHRAEQGLSELGQDENANRRSEFEAAIARAKNWVEVARRQS